MPAGPAQRQMHGYVSVAAFEGWRSFALHNDTNVTSLLEAFGVYLAGLESSNPPPNIREVAAEAQRVAARRSTRVREVPPPKRKRKA